jgi:hypothetical protein
MKGEIRFQTSELVNEEYCFLGRDTMYYSRSLLTFRKNLFSLGRGVIRANARPRKWRRRIPLKSPYIQNYTGPQPEDINLLENFNFLKFYQLQLEFISSICTRSDPELSEPQTPITPNALPATWRKPYRPK